MISSRDEEAFDGLTTHWNGNAPAETGSSQEAVSGRTARKIKRRKRLTENEFKTYEELPLFLNAKMIGKVLGISPASSYELLHQEGFPTLKIGNRLVVPKEKFIAWVEENVSGGTR